jgi:hypothetical protein
MSVSDVAAPATQTIGALALALEQRFTELTKGEATETLDLEHLRILVSVSTRLFAFAADASAAPPVPVDESVSPTEAVALASALLRAHDLNPFDLAAWHSRGLPSER